MSRTNSLTQTHALFLEWCCLQAVEKAGRYVHENGNKGTKPHTPAPLEADCLEVFDTGRTLLATLGHPLFDPVVEPKPIGDEVFCLTRAGITGRGLYTEEGFVVLKGSVGRAANAAHLQGTAFEKLRAQLVTAGVVHIDGAQAIFTKDHLFPTPSRAAVALLGSNANGWVEWKDAAGKTLHDVKRAVGVLEP